MNDDLAAALRTAIGAIAVAAVDRPADVDQMIEELVGFLVRWALGMETMAVGLAEAPGAGGRQ